jgi:LysM repeat protein
MKRVKGSCSAVLLVGLILLSAGLLPVGAQGNNLLTNPGFEAPFITVAGLPPRQVAQGWTPWHVPAAEGMSASENVQPEYYPATDVNNGLGVPRVRSGSDAQQYFSFFATHIGGVYQTVSGVNPGDALTFSVYGYLWSSTFDDADSSEEDGGLLLQVGIDPTGGTDSESANIIWSQPAQTYDSYALYTVSAVAQATSVTVWVRSSASVPVKNNVVYLDDASLVVGAAAPATSIPPTATSSPPTATATQSPVTVVPPTETTVTPTVESAAEFTVTPIPPTATLTNTATPTNTLTPSSTPTPTLTPSDTPIPPTATPIPPTATPTNTPTPSSTPTPTLTPSDTPIPPTATPTFTPTPSPTLDRTQFPVQIIYTVRAGDFVARIAQQFNSTIEAIIIANQLNENGLIFVGQQLIIPLAQLPTATLTPSITPIGATATPMVMVIVVTATPSPTAAATSRPPTGVSPSILYVVQPGDSLSSIAVRFGTTVQAIAQANNILNFNLLFVGQRLVIPSRGVIATPSPQPTASRTSSPVPPITGGMLYRVQPGDNLFKIALRFGVTVNSLVQLNRIVNPSRIYVGQVITIP